MKYRVIVTGSTGMVIDGVILEFISIYVCIYI